MTITGAGRELREAYPTIEAIPPDWRDLLARLDAIDPLPAHSIPKELKSC